MGLPEPPPVGDCALPFGTYREVAVIVTGGGTGLGKAIACEFARLGADVAIASRDADHRARGIDAVESAGGRRSASAMSATPTPLPPCSTQSRRSGVCRRSS